VVVVEMGIGHASLSIGVGHGHCCCEPVLLVRALCLGEDLINQLVLVMMMMMMMTQ
jgi:hypothetical protein